MTFLFAFQTALKHWTSCMMKFWKQALARDWRGFRAKRAVIGALLVFLMPQQNAKPAILCPQVGTAVQEWTHTANCLTEAWGMEAGPETSRVVSSPGMRSAALKGGKRSCVSAHHLYLCCDTGSVHLPICHLPTFFHFYGNIIETVLYKFMVYVIMT